MPQLIGALDFYYYIVFYNMILPPLKKIIQKYVLSSFKKSLNTNQICFQNMGKQTSV